MKINKFRQKVKIQVFMILILCRFVINSSCTYDRGVITDSNGVESKGRIRFSECHDRYVGEDSKSYTEFKGSEFSGWKKIYNRDIKSIRKDENLFVFIDLKKIPGESGGDLKIPAKLIVSGNYSLYSYCSVRYMSTMITSKRLDLNVYLLSENKGGSFSVVPHSLDEFRNFSLQHFSSCPGLVKEIQNRKFTKKIENPVPGNITEYESVDEKDIIEFVDKYNRCVGPL